MLQQVNACHSFEDTDYCIISNPTWWQKNNHLFLMWNDYCLSEEICVREIPWFVTYWRFFPSASITKSFVEKGILGKYINQGKNALYTPSPCLVHFLGLEKFRTNQNRTNEVNNTRFNIHNKFAHKWRI